MRTFWSHLFLRCALCEESDDFHGQNERACLRLARKAGWVLEQLVEPTERCPACEARRNRRAKEEK